MVLTLESSHDPIYLDHNATTPLAPEVLDAMLPFLRGGYGNPSSEHALGRRAHQAVENGRQQVASLIGAAPDEVIFTSGGTESNNIAIRGTAADAAPSRRRIVTSRVEHPATERPCQLLESQGWIITRLPVNRDGSIDDVVFAAALDDDVALLTVMLAQNETGALLAVPTMAAAARPRGIVTHTDAAQAIGKIDVNVDALGVDLLSIAGHKFYAPKGVGALYVRQGTVLEPVLLGASQERGLRPGTENVAGIVGLGAACGLAQSRMVAEAVRISGLREQLWQGLAGRIPGLVRHTPKDNNLPNTLAVSFPEVFGSDVLGLATGLAASTGSACQASHNTPSAVLIALGVEPAVAMGAVRLSLGHDNNREEITAAIDLLVNAYRRTIE
jgi:cysteine desulfurase